MAGRNPELVGGTAAVEVGILPEGDIHPVDHSLEVLE